MPSAANQPQHIHGVHQENPDKQGQTQWGNGLRDCSLRIMLLHVIHESQQNFNSRLKRLGTPAVAFFSAAPQKEAADYAQQNRKKKDCIKVNERKSAMFFSP